MLQSPQQIVNERDGRRAYQSQLDFTNGKVYLVRAIVDGSSGFRVINPANI